MWKPITPCYVVLGAFFALLFIGVPANSETDLKPDNTAELGRLNESWDVQVMNPEGVGFFRLEFMSKCLVLKGGEVEAVGLRREVLLRYKTPPGNFQIMSESKLCPDNTLFFLSKKEKERVPTLKTLVTRYKKKRLVRDLLRGE